MMRAASLLCVCVAGLALVACGSSNRRRGTDSGVVTDSGTVADSGTGTDSGPGTDSSVSTDSGTRPDTSTGRDTGTGPGDPCEAAAADAASTVGCNGGFYGTTARANELGGACTLDGTATELVPGSCIAGPAGTMNICSPEAEGASTGTCAYICTAGSAYVSTGGCPAGSRCFSLTDVALCFRDCSSSADCFAGEMCDAEGSCVTPE